MQHLPAEGLKEGPFLFERKGIYYLTYPHVADKTERLEYATANNPLGPFKVTGVIMDASKDCWTNHQSVVKYKGQWYLFYHHNDYSPHFDKTRSVRADSLFFNDDGTMIKVNSTLRGIGITQAADTIQLDRYTAISDKGASISFLDSTDTFKGWKMVLDGVDTWVKYNTVDFGNRRSNFVYLRVRSETGGKLLLYADSVRGTGIAEMNIQPMQNWKTIRVPLRAMLFNIHNLIVLQKTVGKIEIDWLRIR